MSKAKELFKKWKINFIASMKRLRQSEEKKRRPELYTSFGKWLDRITYKQIAWWMAFVIFGFALLYCLLDIFGWATKSGHINIFDATYFSVITFASLGYGDIAPIGIAKLLAMIEVLAGLSLVALFVGKIASEKQSAQLLLLMTSEQQRRLREFSNAIEEFNDNLIDALTDYDYDMVFDHSKRAVRIVASTSSYLTFQSQQAGLADYGNVSALRAIYRAVADIQATAISILKIQELPDDYRNTLRQLNERAVGICNGMSQYHLDEPGANDLLNHIALQDTRYKTWVEELAAGTTIWNHNANMTEGILHKVFELMPPHPWPKNVHHDVASQLRITNKFAQRCIEELINRNKWPEFTIEKMGEKIVPENIEEANHEDKSD